MAVSVTIEILNKMCEDYKLGVPPVVIAQELGINPITVRNYLTMAGLRKKGERAAYAKPRRNINYIESLCWSCALSSLGDHSPCSWHRKEHTPRTDWVAEKTEMPYNGHVTYSYKVFECPAYVEEKRRRCMTNAIHKQNSEENEG